MSEKLLMDGPPTPQQCNKLNSLGSDVAVLEMIISRIPERIPHQRRLLDRRASVQVEQSRSLGWVVSALLRGCRTTACWIIDCSESYLFALGGVFFPTQLFEGETALPHCW